MIVQPSVYGTENSCTLDALRRLGPRARGVAVIDSSTPDEELEKMKGAGVRGVRVNLQTGGGGPALIEEAAARAAALGWHVQTFARIALLRRLKPLPVPLVVDHFGLPESMEDVRYLALLLRQGNSYVKLSGPHRLRMDPGSVVRALLEANPERCVVGQRLAAPFHARRARSKDRPAFRPDRRRRGARAPARLGGRCGAVSQNPRRQSGAPLRFLGGRAPHRDRSLRRAAGAAAEERHAARAPRRRQERNAHGIFPRRAVVRPQRKPLRGRSCVGPHLQDR